MKHQTQMFVWKPNLALAGQIIGVLRMEDGAVNPCYPGLERSDSADYWVWVCHWFVHWMGLVWEWLLTRLKHDRQMRIPGSKQSLTSWAAVGCARWRPALIQRFTQTVCLQSRTDPRAVFGNFGARCLLPLLGKSRSARRTQQILNIKRRTSWRSFNLRPRRFIVEHV